MSAWSTLWASPVLPAAVALLLRWRSAPLAARERWDRRDTALLLGAAVVGAVAMGWITAPWVMRGFPFTASDFADYCGTLEPIRAGRLADASPYRSVAAGLLPAWLAAPLGVVGGLAAASLVSTAVLCGALYLAGRALHSRTAGLAAVVLATALPPLAALPRTVTFYPEIVGALALATATALASVRFRTPTFALLAGLGAGAAFLVDVRGMLVAAPATIIAIVGVLVAPVSRRSAGLRLAALLAPIALSWWLGGRLHPDGWALQDQAAAYAGDALRQASADPGRVPLATPAERFRWGVDPLDHAVPGVRYLARVSGVLAEHARGSRESAEVARKLGPWPTVLACAALVALLGLRKRPVLAIAGAAAVAPSIAVLHQALTTFPLPRMFATGLPAVALVLGVAFAALARGALPRTDAPALVAPDPDASGLLDRALPAARPALALLALAAMVGGIVPTWLGPTRLWRTWNLTDSEPRELLAETATGRERPAAFACQRALRADLAAGRPLVPTWYGAPSEGWIEAARPPAVPTAPPPR